MPTDGQTRSNSEQRYAAALNFLYDRINYERIVVGRRRYPFRLQRITELMRILGLSHFLHDQTQAANPPSGLLPRPVPLIHIAGTKGKGSTAAMVAAALTQAGFRTGLYTSPHLHQLEERFRINGTPCSAEQLVELVDRVAPAAEAIEHEFGPPSFFELTTALAMLHFDVTACQAIVLEVGLGGRLDSTNVCAPAVSAITSIGLDHQHVLGDTLTQIAAEKAGIIKPHVPVVSGVADSEAARTIAAIAAANDCDLFQLPADFDFVSTPDPEWGSRLQYQGHRFPLSSSLSVELQMEGDHQGRNAAVALAILDLLRNQGMAISRTAARSGLSQLNCGGRIERFRLPRNVLGIVDAAHNLDSIDALCETLRRRCGQGPVAVVFGTSIDKDAATMLQSLGTVADQIMLTRFWGNPRFQPPRRLMSLVAEPLQARTSIVDDPLQACARALPAVTPGGTIVVCGSFFLAAETREWFAVHAGGAANQP